MCCRKVSLFLLCHQTVPTCLPRKFSLTTHSLKTCLSSTLSGLVICSDRFRSINLSVCIERWTLKLRCRLHFGCIYGTVDICNCVIKERDLRQSCEELEFDLPAELMPYDSSETLFVETPRAYFSFVTNCYWWTRNVLRNINRKHKLLCY